MQLQTLVDLTPHNTFGLPAVARAMVHIDSDAAIPRLLDHPLYGPMPKWVLGGGSNVIFTGDPAELVLKVAIKGRRLLPTQADAWIVEVGAGESWHDLVRWTIANGRPGLENLALIPGTVGAAPVQNIGAYGVSLQERFDALDGIDLTTGQPFTLTGDQCRFGYRDSIFKHSLAGRCVITRVRLRLPRPWRPVLDYPDLQRRQRESGSGRPDPQQVFDWVCALRRAKLPDPATVGNAGSFFKNPVVTADRFAQLLRRHPAAVGYRQPDGRVKLAAGWLIETCGWRGRTMGRVGVYAHQALVLVNQGGATGIEVLALARAIQESVKGRFGITLEIEPTVV
ncbi:UDP-N-acetylmuramate dehydrogenase [Desulfatitalea alkaliphila]|uniref:UDP-N-acetylenolpyruvoylglucosamine reductase n=1 Tax=Desulfatitalea alkaliphila TaxID=2929485 RepID=A0AA41UL71_9BACT|nr:UDP-N-acetylmuramate dehydrogenase [Desulfatitalea alkaliphila]MCJ8501166.1 UDP-N-acetylmuramate dehydrogenase [Desulfatitalea alkaliphila]